MITLIFSLISMFSVATHAAHYRPQPIPDDLQIRGQFDYSRTSSNYPMQDDISGALGGDQKFERLLVTAEGGYSFSDQMRAWAGINGGQARATVINPYLTSFNTIVTEMHTNAGINEGFLGGQYWFPYRNVHFVGQFDFTFPFWRVNTNSNDPLIGEGAMVVQPGAWIIADMKGFTPFLYGGFAYRDGGRSSLMPFDVGGRYTHPIMQWWGQLSFRGYESVIDDDNTSFTGRFDRRMYLFRVQGGSYDFYSINPSRGEIAGSAGMQFDNIGIYLGGWVSVYGNASADGWGAFAGVTFNSEHPGTKRRKVRQNRFNHVPESYDESVFEEPVAVPPAPTEPIYEEPPPAPPPQAPPLKKTAPGGGARKGGDEQMPNVEMLMKDTQKTLEKRSR